MNWALADGADLRQLALVFDWCQPSLTERTSEALAAKIERGLQAASKDSSVPAVRDRVLAAVALAGHLPGPSEQQLRLIVEQWWRGQIVSGPQQPVATPSRATSCWRSSRSSTRCGTT